MKETGKVDEALSVVGKRLPRWQAHAKATGAAKFTVDIKLPGMLAGKILTSPYPHARIVKVDKSRAEKLPGVEAVITFEDVPKMIFNPNKINLILFHPENEIKDMYVLSDKARYVGDRIAAVAAIDAAVAEEALELIEVEYEVLPAVFDPVEAMKEGAPRIHDFAENNISRHIPFRVPRGDVDKALKEADVVIEEKVSTSKQHLCQLEPCTTIASFDADGRLTIWSPSQHVFLHRRKMAEIFDMPEGKIRWITAHVGGGWGKYGSLSSEPVCAALSIKTGKPVKIEYSREEDFLCTETREAYFESGKIGVNKEGMITALQEKIIVHGGAYFTHNSSATGTNMGSYTGLYRCPNVDAEADAVYTNIPVSGGCRGYGNPQALFLLEQMVDMAAEQIGMDPLELRLKNIKKDGDVSKMGTIMETCPMEETIRMGAERIGWKEKRARVKGDGVKRYGIGMAIYMDVSGATPHSNQDRNAFIKFNEDGSASLIVSANDMGQNIMGALSQIAAEVLGIRYEDINVITGDTDVNLFDVGQHANCTCYQTGNAVINAANEAKKQLLERATKHLVVPADKLEVKDRRIYVKAEPDKGIAVKEVTREALYNFKGEHLNIWGRGSYIPTQNPVPVGAMFTEVIVDTETGEVDVLKVLVVHDIGRSINPATVEGQLEGGIVQGLGYTLTEDYYINMKNGVLESDNFTTYKIPSTLDIPEIELLLYEEPVPSGPFGAKGVGMSGLLAVAPAIANAIYDAAGVRIMDMPLTAERILKTIKNRSGV
ncbi:xanthine dehydrogenase family protein molybdopterin-binding subunit [Chloroflexota bacterium]